MPISGAWNLDQDYLLEIVLSICKHLKDNWNEKKSVRNWWLMLETWLKNYVEPKFQIPDYDRPGCLMPVLTIWNCFKLTRNYCNQFVILSRERCEAGSVPGTRQCTSGPRTCWMTSGRQCACTVITDCTTLTHSRSLNSAIWSCVKSEENLVTKCAI